MLHWLDDPLLAFREAHRLLEVDGLLMFSTFGPDTLKELRASFADGYVHTQRFTDMHDYGDMLVGCGFADPVMDAEILTMTYASFDDLLADLRRSGSTARCGRDGMA
jgi:malonyl-CoA O-methyltransferase